jgi:hypothetical protein
MYSETFRGDNRLRAVESGKLCRFTSRWNSGAPTFQESATQRLWELLLGVRVPSPASRSKTATYNINQARLSTLSLNKCKRVLACLWMCRAPDFWRYLAVGLREATSDFKQTRVRLGTKLWCWNRLVALTPSSSVWVNNRTI